jgi:beta-lactamase regulating signal transducer with metallopeptidase domain
MNLSVVELAVKVSAVMILAAGAALLMRRRASASSRHLLWTVAVAAVLVLPLASTLLPPLAIPIAEAPRATFAVVSEGRVAAVPETPATIERPANVEGSADPSSLALLYGAGVVLLLCRLVFEQWKTRRLLSRTTAIDEDRWTALLHECVARVGLRRAVRLVRSREQAMPMTCGIRRPIIVMPSVAESWNDDRRRAVLLHELAHVARFDCFTQALAELAVAIYWLHPGAWLMARQLRIERELASDDLVLFSGTEPGDYAGHLLEIAHSLGGRPVPALVVRMAHPSQLEGRMRALLDATRIRTVPALGRRLAALAIAALIVAPLAAATPVTSPAKAPATATERLATPAAPDRTSSSLTPGTWQIRRSTDGKTANLIVSASEHSSHSLTVPLDRVDGLAAILAGPGGPARYRLARDAGTFEFEGMVRAGVGGGTFTFVPSPTFPVELAKRGFAKPTLVEQQVLAGADIGFAFIDELEAQRYARPSLAQLANAAMHGVSRNDVRELSTLGYRLGTVDALVRLRDHGVDAQFIRGLQTEGLPSLTADDAVRARGHGVDPEYVRGLRTLGYGRLTLGQLVNARDHGVDPTFARELGALGYSGLSIEQLIVARDHGVSPEYIRQLRELGYRPTMAELAAGRDHGIDAEQAKAIVSAGYARPALAELIRLRDHGVTADYARSAAQRGSHPSIDHLIELHDRGPRAEPESDRGKYHDRSTGVLYRLDRVHRAFIGFFRRLFGR